MDQAGASAGSSREHFQTPNNVNKHDLNGVGADTTPIGGFKPDVTYRIQGTDKRLANPNGPLLDAFVVPDQSQPVNFLTVSVLPTIVIALWAVYNTWLQHPEKVESHAKGIFSWFRGFLTRSAKWLAFRILIFGPLICLAVIAGICGFSEWPLSRTNFVLVIECVVAGVFLLLVPVVMVLSTLSKLAEGLIELVADLIQRDTETLDRISKVDESHQVDKNAIEELKKRLAQAQKPFVKIKGEKK